MNSKNRKTKHSHSRNQTKRSKIASTADILPASNHPRRASNSARVPRKWSSNHRHLLELRSKLLRQMGQLAEQANEPPAPFGMHMADAGTDSFDRDFALSLLSSDQNALYEIEEAIKRIENGTYGVCELTGRQIPKARLDAIPWTRFSVQAQRDLEKEGIVRRARFADLGSIEEAAGAAVETEEDQEEKAAGE